MRHITHGAASFQEIGFQKAWPGQGGRGLRSLVGRGPRSLELQVPFPLPGGKSEFDSPTAGSGRPHATSTGVWPPGTGLLLGHCPLGGGGLGRGEASPALCAVLVQLDSFTQGVSRSPGKRLLDNNVPYSQWQQGLHSCFHGNRALSVSVARATPNARLSIQSQPRGGSWEPRTGSRCWTGWGPELKEVPSAHVSSREETP